jgi:hypothetical protein
MGLMTIISSLVLVAMIVWGSYTFLLVQFNQVRPYDPHYEYDDIPDWPYQINWSGGRSNWFDNVNYTDFDLDDLLPDDLLSQLNNTIFFVTPEDPPQLWRSTAYDAYDGSGWSKSSISADDFTSNLITSDDAAALGNTVYQVYLNVSGGPGVGSIELPTLFPDILVVEDSFETGDFDSGTFQPHSPSRLISYDLESDEYGSLLFSPFFEGQPESIIVSYELTYRVQDTLDVANRALDGFLAPPSISNLYTPVPSLSAAVIQNITPFMASGNAYQTAVDVESYFRTTFELMIQDYNDRPPPGQELTDWFLARGGGLPQDFVTAYCVFLRYLGVPARPALGYAVGAAMGGYRSIQVRHMMFWAEVFVPMSGHPDFGEWIQVIPIPLPSDMGGDEIPENTGAQNVQLLVAPVLFEPWAIIGDPFDIVAALFLDYTLVTTPETIQFYDEGMSIGSATIDGSGLATLNYAFPSDATVGVHNISATWTFSTFTIMNYTYVSAVADPNPMMASDIDIHMQPLAEIIDVDIRQGFTNYTAHWNDTVHVHGVMTDHLGVPIDGTTLINDQMEIVWDGTTIASTTIQSNGSYSYDAYVDPLDAVLMSIGSHDIWSFYGGEIDPDTGFWKYLPSRSAENSTVTIYGLAVFNLVVTPTTAYRDATLHYEGYLELMDGTPLPFETVDIYLDGVYLDSRITNISAQFEYDYVIPSAYPLGQVDANVTWVSTIGGISDSSEVEAVTIGLRPVELIIDSVPDDPIWIQTTIIVNGTLRDAVNGTGLVGRTVDLWWFDGVSMVNVNSTVTGPGGYYEIEYYVPLGAYEGLVPYWTNYTSIDPIYEDKQSITRYITVKKFDITVTIQADPDPVYVLGTLRIQGNLFVPELGDLPLPGETVELWWHNATDGWHHIADVFTNGTGGYIYYFPIPLLHELGNVTLYAYYNSVYTNAYDGESVHLYPVVDTRPTLLTVDTSSSSYYLNETAFIYGQLLNTTGGIPDQTIYIHWINSTDTLIFTATTNSTGHYNYSYPLSLFDGPDTVSIFVNFTSPSPAYSDAFAMLIPSLTLQLYETDITVAAISGVYHLNETIYVTGTLSFVHNGQPIGGETVAVHYLWWNGTEIIDYVATNGLGVFNSQYDFVLTDALGAIYVWAQYTSSNPLWDNFTSGSQTTNLELYSLELNVSPPSPVYLDQGVLIDGFLTHLGGSPPLATETVRIYIASSPGGPWTFLVNRVTDATGYFQYMHYFTVPPDTEGIYYFMCNYTSTDPLNADATTGALPVNAQKYEVTMDLVVLTNPVYQNETVAIYIHLYYTVGGGDIDGVSVDLFWLNGTEYPLTTIITNVTGEFTFYYSEMDDDTIRTGIEVYGRYAGNLTVDATESNHDTLTLLQWQTIQNGFAVGSPSYYILETMTISGTLVYVANSAPIGGAVIELLMEGSPVTSGLTLPDGSFFIPWIIPESTTPGTYEISARFQSPDLWIADYTSVPSSVLVQQYTVNLTASVDTNLVYLGNSVTISGTLTFSNGTAMDGYDVEIHWDNGLDMILQTITITDSVSGSFAYVHNIDWSHPLGVSWYYVVFVRPNAAYEPASTAPDAVEVWDLVSIDLVPQTVFTANRGDTVVVSGFATHGGFDAPDVPIAILANGTPIDFTITEVDGTFTISLIVPSTAPPGTNNITIDVQAPSYYERFNVPRRWFITVSIDSVVILSVPNDVEVQPGERFTLSVQIQDADGTPVIDPVIDIYLNTTFLLTRTLTAPDIQIVIPMAWAASGKYVVIVEYGGNPGLYLRASTGETSDSIHIFTEVVFDFSRSPPRVNPGLEFTLSVELTDDLGIPIVDRRVRFNLNGTDTDFRFTDASGIVTLSMPAIDNPANFTFSVTLLSAVSPVSSEDFTLEIDEPGGGFLDPMDLLLPALLIGAAVVVVFLYLYFVRGFGKSIVGPEDHTISQRLHNIKKLADAGRYSAAIHLAYRTFEELCGTKMSSERRLSETARDFVARTLEQIPLDEASVDELLGAYEEARFSDHEVTRERYENTMRVFTDLYPRIEAVVVTIE